MVYQSEGLPSSIICATDGIFSTALSRLVGCTQAQSVSETTIQAFVSAANNYCHNLVATAFSAAAPSVTAPISAYEASVSSYLSSLSAASRISASSVLPYQPSNLGNITACLSYFSNSQLAPPTLSCDFSKLGAGLSVLVRR